MSLASGCRVLRPPWRRGGQAICAGTIAERWLGTPWSPVAAAELGAVAQAHNAACVTVNSPLALITARPRSCSDADAAGKLQRVTTLVASDLECVMSASPFAGGCREKGPTLRGKAPALRSQNGPLGPREEAAEPRQDAPARATPPVPTAGGELGRRYAFARNPAPT